MVGNIGLFSASAMGRATAILDSLIVQPNNQDYTLLFGITYLPPFEIEYVNTETEPVTWMSSFSPENMISDSLEGVKSTYNQALLNKYFADNPNPRPRQTILLHNTFIYPYKGGVLTFTHIGYVSQTTIPALPRSQCGSLSPLQPQVRNDSYLLAIANGLAAPRNIYTPQDINDRLAVLSPVQIDSIGLMRDTVRDERGWHVKVDIIVQGCTQVAEVIMDTLQQGQRVQVIIEVGAYHDGNPSYNVHLFASQQIRRSLPPRYMNYVRDSVALPELRNNRLYSGVIRAMERFRRPLPGDPLFEMRVAPTNANNPVGGMYGCSRRKDGSECSPLFPDENLYPGKNKNHWGLDLGAVVNTDFFAMYAGTVHSVYDLLPFPPNGSQTPDIGNYVIIRHTSAQYGGPPGAPDLYTKYAHLNAIYVNQHQQVVQGQLIGQSGRTGNAGDINTVPNPHIHLETSLGGTLIADKRDPRYFLYTQFDLNGNTTN